MEATACYYPYQSFYGIIPRYIFYIMIGMCVWDAASGFQTRTYDAGNLLHTLLASASAIVIEAVVLLCINNGVPDMDVVPLWGFLMLSCAVLVPLLCYQRIYGGGCRRQQTSISIIVCGVSGGAGLLFSWLDIFWLPSGRDIPDCQSHETILRHVEAVVVSASALELPFLRWVTLPPTILTILVLGAATLAQSCANGSRMLWQPSSNGFLCVLRLPGASRYDRYALGLIVACLILAVYAIILMEVYLWEHAPWCQSGPKTFSQWACVPIAVAALAINYEWNVSQVAENRDLDGANNELELLAIPGLHDRSRRASSGRFHVD